MYTLTSSLISIQNDRYINHILVWQIALKNVTRKYKIQELSHLHQIMKIQRPLFISVIWLVPLQKRAFFLWLGAFFYVLFSFSPDLLLSIYWDKNSEQQGGNMFYFLWDINRANETTLIRALRGSCSVTLVLNKILKKLAQTPNIQNQTVK